MSKQSKHERIIRESLEEARAELKSSLKDLQAYQLVTESIETRINMLERLLGLADADKGGDDAES